MTIAEALTRNRQQLEDLLGLDIGLLHLGGEAPVKWFTVNVSRLGHRNERFRTVLCWTADEDSRQPNDRARAAWLVAQLQNLSDLLNEEINEARWRWQLPRAQPQLLPW